ncbi:hypothetical protein LAUMK4_00616 [Mycobacterium persicum]|uniref:Uncharacterized protein n=1 Tax=Mycobacterium persicum TaxID=1487726 RepID=A0ABY6RCW5_9MYCO|nr:hypothetical protein LAUMK15_00971 [Mycobacterium persicum]VAZ88175.1 hypothetical protein LAUMK4_00616 [Mycobacterium persicum]
MNLEASGNFWVPADTKVKVQGSFKADPGQKPEAILATGLVDDPRVKVSGGISIFTDSPDETVNAFLPITLHAQLTTGESVTLLRDRAVIR